MPILVPGAGESNAVCHAGDESESDANDTSTFAVLRLKREDCRACFYSTLQLKHQLYSWLQGGEGCGPMGQRAESVAAVGCRVLPICDVASLGTRGDDTSGEVSEKDAQKRRKAVSRMKELVRWAAAARASKAGIKRWKIMYLRSKMAVKDAHDDDASSSSSKISFRWDAGSCSASSSVFSPLSMPSACQSEQVWAGKNPPHSAAALQSSNSNASTTMPGRNRGGQWITSDSDFVVLEL